MFSGVQGYGVGYNALGGFTYRSFSLFGTGHGKGGGYGGGGAGSPLAIYQMIPYQ
jgi:hypothetical protein